MIVPMNIAKIITLVGLAESASVATQQIAQNGVSLDGVTVTHPTMLLVPDRRQVDGWHSFHDGDSVVLQSIPSKGWHPSWPTVGTVGTVDFTRVPDCSPNAVVVRMQDASFWILTRFIIPLTT